MESGKSQEREQFWGALIRGAGEGVRVRRHKPEESRE
jgi:hypothetical protein